MKIGIVGDIHLGINENKILFDDYHFQCLDYIYNEFTALGIQDIIYLGDVFDKRYSISVKTLEKAKDLFNNKFNQHFLVGNHDATYKNSNKLNSVEILLGDKNKVVANLPEELIFDDKKFLMVPWLNKTNYDQCINTIDNSDADYMFGHLDLSGFEMVKGFLSKKGQVEKAQLRKFKQVVTGHFHGFSQKKNITYLGSVCQMNWNDYGLEKFAGYIDTKTDRLELIKIPYEMYDIIRIRTNKDIVDANQYKNKIIKCYLYTQRTIKIEKFITELVDICQSVNVIDEQVMLGTEDINIDSQDMSVSELWKSYLDELEIPKKDATIVNKIFNQTYMKVTTGDLT